MAKLMMDCSCFYDPCNFCSSRISSRAPLKFVPLSDMMWDGQPRLATNLWRTTKKSSVDREEQMSRCTAFVVRQTNTTAYVSGVRT